MTSAVSTKNMFDTLSEEKNFLAEIKDNQISSEKKQDNWHKTGKQKNGQIKYVLHNKYIPESEKVMAEAFANMSDKESIAKKLKCTKACNFALKNPVTGKYGTCFRSSCTFAHSLEELNDPMCEFDSMCRYKHGRYNKNGEFDVTLKCTFRHSTETQEKWLERTGKTLPDLPKTLSKPVEEKVLGSGYSKKTTPFTPPKRITLDIPSAPVKPPAENIVKKESNEKVNKNLSKEYSEKPTEQSLNSNNNLYIIKVPSKELAEIAIKSAFKNGVFNIQVIIE